uniref:ATP synthase F0 subunit 6 n=1 Tax=Brachytarsina amboinensis TaxID=3018683 RepID=UPI0023AA4D2A|nr:ATP synthase F0 subunit 6 [Brachytarsina amboinensis]WCL18788.1 ATP synthase F0 subunit 6 [Brachytarsina amboinensis]WHN64463.1 ATP synthase F0 subunit 6 [Brachytarsina amboinensis]
MMTNLFSSFDPSSNIFSLNLNWLSSMIGILLIPPMYWLIPSRYNLLWNKLLMILHKEFKIILKSKMYNSTTLIFISLFSMILFNNFMGLFPYIFTSTSHMIFTISLSLPLWMSFMLFGWMNNTNHMFLHMIPQGTPFILMPFMVCIESISNLIRPMTLAIRLSANMISGHLLLTLLGNTGNKISLMILLILICTQIMLLVLESAVAIIQSYVFAILTTLYSNEIN